MARYALLKECEFYMRSWLGEKQKFWLFLAILKVKFRLSTYNEEIG